MEKEEEEGASEKGRRRRRRRRRHRRLVLEAAVTQAKSTSNTLRRAEAVKEGRTTRIRSWKRRREEGHRHSTGSSPLFHRPRLVLEATTKERREERPFVILLLPNLVRIIILGSPEESRGAGTRRPC